MNETLVPDDTAIDSSPWNNPSLSPFLQVAPNGQLPLGSVPEGTAIGSPGFGFEATPQGPRNMLMALRAQFPWLPIIPPTTKSISGSLAANVVQTVEVPSGVIAGIFLCSGPCFMSYGGKASIPANGVNSDNAGIFAPNNIMFYLGGTRELSFIAPVDNTYFSVALYYASELPR